MPVGGKIERFHGYVFDARSHQQLRPATGEEASASARAAKHEGRESQGVIVVDQRAVYVAHEAHVPALPVETRVKVRVGRPKTLRELTGELEQHIRGRPRTTTPSVGAELHPGPYDERPLTLDVDGKIYETTAHVSDNGEVAIVKVPRAGLKEQVYDELERNLAHGVRLAQIAGHQQRGDPYRTDPDALVKTRASEKVRALEAAARRKLDAMVDPDRRKRR